MTDPKDKITGLIDALCADFSDQIAPALPADQKYNTAMVKRGLEILGAYLRQTCEDVPADSFIFSQQTFTRNELAQALRDRQETGIPSAILREHLKNDVLRRRQQANPKALFRSEDVT